MKNLIWLFALSLTIHACAPYKLAQKYSKYISETDARNHLSILASDEFEGRETGKPGAEKAANYIADEFKKLGLTAPVNGSYFQNVPLVESVPEVSSLTVNQSTLTLGKDFLITPAGIESKLITANNLVFVGYGITDPYDNLKGIDLTGKVVMLINSGEGMKSGLQNISSKNPGLIITVNDDVDQQLLSYSPVYGKLAIKKPLPEPKRTSPLIINITPKIANLFLKKAGKTYDMLKSAIDNSMVPKPQIIASDISLTYEHKPKAVNAVNVLGFLEGSDLKDEVLVISAHYDHIGLTAEGSDDKVNNGADDDGSGTTGVLEIARAFSKAKNKGKGPRRSILFLTFVGEEKGLLGSKYYSENPIFPLKNTIADLNIDMIGRIGSDYKNNPDSVNYCYLIGSDKLSTDLHKISEKANATYTKLKIDYKYNDPKDPERIYYRSDHYNFAKHNIPIVFYFNGVHEDYHKPGDEVNKINFPLLTKRAKLVFFTGWELANRDKRPVVDITNDMPNSR